MQYKIYTDNKYLNIKEYFDLAQKNLISVHPNDSLLVRWGEEEAKTTCPAFY